MKPRDSKGPNSEAGVAGFPKTVQSVATIALLFVAILLTWPFLNGLSWGLVLSGIAFPFHQRMRSRIPNGLSASASVVVTLVVLVAPVALICLFISDQARTVAANGGVPESGLDHVLARIQALVDPRLEPFGLSFKVEETWRANKGAWSAATSSVVYRSVQSAGRLVIDMGIGVFAQFFLLRDVDIWRAWGRSNARLDSGTFDRICQAGYKSVQSVFKGVVVVACLQGFIIGLTYMIAGLPNWGTLAVLSGLLCIIPFLGAPVVYIPVAVMLLMNGETWQGVLVLAIGIGIVGQIDNLLRPFLIAGKVGLHPLIVFVSLMGGVLLMGPVGLIAGPVVFSVLNVLWGHSNNESISSPLAPVLEHEVQILTDRKGLSDIEATTRLKAQGFNELPSTKGRGPVATALSVIREPMFLLLIACATVYVILGEKSEAAMLSSAVAVVVGITFFQERKTERTLDALRELASPRALVIRGGEQRRIPGREVVIGDLLVLSEGDRVPADCILLDGPNVAADESLLTGESAAVRKTASVDAEMRRPGGDDTPYLFSGTLVVQGRGIALVKATAQQTEIGKIGQGLATVPQEPTLLQRSTNRLVRLLSISGGILCIILIITFGLTRGSWLQAVLAGMTMAMAAIPEEFPVVLTIFLALGAWRIAQKNVLTRRVPAIETLGAATALCVDKTGTLTQNRMTVSHLSVSNDIVELKDGSIPDFANELVRFAKLASQPEPFDPMEKAIRTSASKLQSHDDWVLSRQYPLSPALLAMTHAWKMPGEPGFIIAAKGAPEAISTLCHLDEERTRSVEKTVVSLAENGLRVIAVAKAVFHSEDLPEVQQSFEFEFIGLIGLHDPVRPGVESAVQECYAAGIRTIMITGDYPETARSIAQKIGIRSPELVVTGEQLSRMSLEELQEQVRSVNVFARVMPEQKLLLVNALKANKEVVAMTGDGVNDAPALKAADIGIAMGQRGTDVAREVADLVLLDDDFSSIVHATRLGRRIYANIKDAMSYVLAIHVPIAGLSLVPVLVGWPLILLPVHIVFLELIIDPACSIVFEGEPEDEDTMRRPPRDRNEPLFTRKAIALSLIQGVGVLIVELLVFYFARHTGYGDNGARALTYTTLIVANVTLILSNLSLTQSIVQVLRRPNKALWIVLASVLASVLSVLYVPFFRETFRFAILSGFDIAICLGAGILSVLWAELLKIPRRRKTKILAGRTVPVA